MGPTQRQLRVGEMLRRSLAELLVDKEFKDPDAPNVPITVGEVRVSPDLKRATVFVLPLGGQQADEVVAALNKERRHIRRLLNSGIHLKHSPHLTFVADTMFDQLDEMKKLFSQERVVRDIEGSASVEKCVG